MNQRIKRALGGGDDFDAAAIEQRSRAEFIAIQFGVDGIEIMVRSLAGEPDIDAKGFGKHPVEPDMRGRAAKQVIVLREQPPCLARVRGGCLALACDSQIFHRDALRIGHAQHLVIGLQQQLGRIAKTCVLREP
jgi:hypothetical protein